MVETRKSSQRVKLYEKKSTSPPPSTMEVDYLTLSTLKSDILFFENSKTVEITLLDGFRWWFRYNNHDFARVIEVLSFSFLFILAESLKNHSKS
jgi:hypothetical protein